ncbi:MAG: hypothetical protein E7487_05690 [Ruminococcaceae bacterium]|nr:hypothetical protein [Oscillospiraceae bacterium]
MKNTRRKLLGVILAIGLCFLAACAKGKMTIKIDENGMASWKPEKNAVAYEYALVDQDYTNNGIQTTTETSVQLLSGYCLQLRAVYENGQTGMWITSDFYYGTGEETQEPGQEYEEDAALLVDHRFTVKMGDLKTYNLMENIDYSTVQQTADGGVSFVAAAPNGGEMRFVGTAGITVQPGEISFEPGSSIMALDSIGRICMYKPVVSDSGQGDNWVNFTGGYTFDGTTRVDSRSELFEVWPFSISVQDAYDEGYYGGTSALNHQPNMIGIGAADSRTNTDAFTLSELVVYYDETTYATPIAEMVLDPESYRAYMEGDLYDPTKEVFDPAKEIYDFHLLVLPLLSDKAETTVYDIEEDYGRYLGSSVQSIDMSRITIGDLKDAGGNVLDKAADALSFGVTLEISLDGGPAYDMPLQMLEQYKGAQNLHQLVPYKNIFSEGSVNALVIPLMWQDYPDLANDALMDKIRTFLGRVADRDGNVTDCSVSEADGYSLSSYYDAVSNGRYHIDSFVTDWCPMNYKFEDIQDSAVMEGEWKNEALQWAKETYGELDWDSFDANGDGILDAVIFVGANPEMDSYYMTSFGGATQNSPSYIPENTETAQQPVIKEFIYIGSNILGTENVLIHEYAHNFGLIDYYDVTYSGIDAVGHFDMQSSNVGDWNAYSKYSVGWIDPHIVQDLAAGESVEFTIGAQSDTGDAIVIPAAGADFDGPFGEYMMVDLFTDSGVNRYDAEKYGLSGVTGVRIYHVNAGMERRVLNDDYGTEYPIGTVHYANAYTKNGKYHIELLQKGGDNTFTDLDNLRTNLLPQDLFYAGERFDAVNYGEFLTDGRMDNGDEFGYIIEVVKITETDGKPVATIRITRK